MIKQKNKVVNEMYEGRVRSSSTIDTQSERLIQTKGGSIIDRVTGEVIVAGTDLASGTTHAATAQKTVSTPQPEVATQTNALTTAEDNRPVSQIVAEFQEIGSRLGTMTIRELRSPDIRKQIDGFHSLGRADIAKASMVVSTLGTKNFVGETDSEAFKSMQELTTIFGDLQYDGKGSKGRGWLSWIPGLGNSVINYLEKFKSSTEMIDSLIGKLDVTQATLDQHDRELANIGAQLADNRFNLEDVSEQMRQMIEVIERALTTVEDPERKAYIESEMLYFLRRNLQSVESERSMVVSALLNIDQQRSMSRSLHAGVDEMKTHGMSALSLAVNLARTQGFQIKTATALMGAREAINSLMTANAKMSEQTADVMMEYESKPLADVQVVADAVTIMLNTIKKTQNARIENGRKVQENITKIQNLLGNSSIQMRLESAADEIKDSRRLLK